MRSLNLKVYGIVQGVFFRQYIKEIAATYDIYGWVKNCPDGSVEILAQGKEELIAQFFELCQQGPQNANVKNIEILQDDSIDSIQFNNFSIVY